MNSLGKIICETWAEWHGMCNIRVYHGNVKSNWRCLMADTNGNGKEKAVELKSIFCALGLSFL